jgi:hypothetical protein
VGWNLVIGQAGRGAEASDDWYKNSDQRFEQIEVADILLTADTLVNDGGYPPPTGEGGAPRSKCRTICTGDCLRRHHGRRSAAMTGIIVPDCRDSGPDDDGVEGGTGHRARPRVTAICVVAYHAVERVRHHAAWLPTAQAPPPPPGGPTPLVAPSWTICSMRRSRRIGPQVEAAWIRELVSTFGDPAHRRIAANTEEYKRVGAAAQTGHLPNAEQVVRIDSARRGSRSVFRALLRTTQAFVCALAEGTPRALEHAELRWVDSSDVHSLDWSEADLPIAISYFAATR